MSKNSKASIEKLKTLFQNLMTNSFDMETLNQGVHLLESLELTRQERDLIVQIDEVKEYEIVYKSDIPEPIAEYIAIYLVGAYYQEYCPLEHLNHLNLKFHSSNNDIRIDDVPINLNQIHSIETLDLRETCISHVSATIEGLNKLKKLLVVPDEMPTIPESFSTRNIEFFEVEDFFVNEDSMDNLSRDNDIITSQLPFQNHSNPYIEIILNQVYGEENYSNALFFIGIKNSQGTFTDCIVYSAYAEFGPYCDYGYDGYGSIDSEYVPPSELNRKLSQLFASNGPSVSIDGFLERPDYTIKKLVHCIPHPNNVDQTVMKYKDKETAQSVLQELQAVEKRIAEVRSAWEHIANQKDKT